MQPNRKWKIQDGGLQTGSTYISACRHDIKEIQNGIPTLSTSCYPMRLKRIFYNQTGSGKSKMAASKPEILLSRLVDEIETKSQRLNLHFRGQAIQRKKGEHWKTKPEVENPRWRPPNRNHLYLGLWMR